MRIFGLLVTFSLHPFLMPTYGFLIYQFQIVQNPEFAYSRYDSLKIFIISAVLPALGKLLVQEIKISRIIPNWNTYTRLVPQILFILAVLVLLTNLPAYNENLALKFFLTGLILANITQIMVSFTGSYLDTYLVGTGALLSYVYTLSLYFSKELIPILIFCIMTSGILASLRAYFVQKGYAGIISGFLMGLIAPFSILKFWFEL